jgi:hypothetical protein
MVASRIGCNGNTLFFSMSSFRAYCCGFPSNILPKYAAHFGFPVLLSLFILQTGWAQQNLFNVPSGTVTRKDEVFLQEQFNFSRIGQSNTTIDYGLGNNWEVGLNILKINLYPGNVVPLPGESDDDALLFNVQKGFRPFKTLTFEIGTQHGISANNAAKKVDYLNFTWGVSRWTPEDSGFKGTVVSGVYYGNTNFLGSGSDFGWMCGVEYPLWRDDVSLVADFISGTNNASVAVVGGQWTLSEKKGWQLSLGAQLPSPHSGNDYGAVFEITKFPPSFAKSSKE